jgi:uncharacterized membrane protein YebE (DUF533 family)
MASESTQIMKEIAPAGGTAIATVSGGLLTALQYMPILLGCIATIAGTILSMMLAWKAYNDIQGSKKLKQAEIDDIKYRQKHDLPCRRCTDKECK